METVRTMKKSKKIRILIVDDHPAMREGLRGILHSADDLAICGEAENGKTAIAAVKKLQPDLAIVDISLREKLDGLNLMRFLHTQWPALPMLAFSLHQERAYCDAALAAGARGYCTKGEPGKVIIEAVRRILQGKAFISKILRE
jgi:DNA-binding NarL/FixJ family response regulator